MTLTLTVNGTPYRGWKTIAIDRSIETLSGGFQLGVSERWEDGATPRPIQSGDECTVKIDNDLVITGYVNAVNPSFDDKSHTLEVSGRDKAGDLIDCSAINAPGQWNNQKLEKIASAIAAPFGISVSAEVNTGEAFKKFSIEQGETAYEAIHRLCKLRAVLCISDRQGGLLLTAAGNSRAATALVQGENILGGTGNEDDRDRFSTVYVKGQTQGDDNKTGAVITKCKGRATDSEITRYRPLLVVAEGQADSKQCQERAEWVIRNRKGKSKSFRLTVPGWRQGNRASAPLWDINTLVYVKCPFFRMNGVYLIAGVRYTLNGQGGHITELTVVEKSAFELVRELSS